MSFAEDVLLKTFYPAGIHFAVVEDDFCSMYLSAGDVAANAFEPLVTREDFQAVKKIMDSNNRKKKSAQEVYAEDLEQLPDNFPNMVYCADCGRAMYFARYMHDYVSKKRTVACYVCNSPIAIAPCGRRTVYDDFLKIVVMDQIHVLIKSMCDRKKLLDKITTSRDGKGNRDYI